MAIIRASKVFAGGDLNQRASTYIKTGTRLVDFRNKENGVFLFLLGAYKADQAGNGVWYRPLKIRDNFGLGMYKDKFAVAPNCPIEYFANKVQTFAPDMAKSKETVEDDGRKRWIYPAWGRNTWRVLYNSAIVNDYGSGVHVLDLPMNGGGSVIDEHVRGRDSDGVENPDLTDYQAAIPLNIKLDLKAKGQPWKIQINQAKTYVLPAELADTDYLYNLDEVINYPDPDELIEKLRSMVPTDIFNKGLEGYSGNVRTVVSAAIPRPAASRPAPVDDIPMSFENPVSSPAHKSSTVAPSISIPKSNQARNEAASEAPAYVPSSSNSKALAEAAAFLTAKKK